MKRTSVLAAAIVVFVGAGVIWAFAAHHGSSIPSVSGVQKVLSGIQSHLPKHLPQVGKCLNGSLSHAGTCIGHHLPSIPSIGGAFGQAGGGGGSSFDHRVPAGVVRLLGGGGSGFDH
jgi:hypothetical protein